MTKLQHKTLETVTTVVDKGEFSAIAACYSVDRVGDRIIPGAFAKTISAWQQAQKNVPLHWDHSAAAEDIIGWITPPSMRETDEGLYVEGQLDLKSSAVAREVWRSMKNNAVALSFGYLPTKQRKAKDGVNELLELDVFEVSIVAAPANPDTRFLNLKNVEAALASDEQTSAVEDGRDEEPETVKSAPQDPLVREAWEFVTWDARARVPKRFPQEPEPEPEAEPEMTPDELQREAWRSLL